MYPEVWARGTISGHGYFSPQGSVQMVNSGPSRCIFETNALDKIESYVIVYKYVYYLEVHYLKIIEVV